MEILLKTIWLMLPAGVANMSPVFFKWLPILNFPVDFGFTFKGQSLFGRNKTYRGFLVGTLMAILTVFLQKNLFPYTVEYSIIDYSHANVWLVGFLLGFGALFGDAFKSFFKRRMKVKAGDSWPPFDQIDWILGALIFVSFYEKIEWRIWILAIIVFGIAHPAANLFGYIIGIKEKKL